MRVVAGQNNGTVDVCCTHGDVIGECGVVECKRRGCNCQIGFVYDGVGGLNRFGSVPVGLESLGLDSSRCS